MVVIDYVLLALLLFFAVMGFFRGIVSQLFSIVGMVGGFMGAKLFYLKAVDWAGLDVQYGTVIAFILMFLAIFIIVKLLGVLLEKILKAAKLSLFNRFCGFFLGLVKGFALCVLLVVLMLFLYPEGRKIVNASPVASYFLKAADGIYSIMPSDLKKRVEFIQIEKAK